MRIKRTFILFASVLVIIVLFASWWNIPVRFLNHVSAGEVARIEVIGAKWEEFVITEPKDIEYIVGNIQSVSLKKEKISLTYAGAGILLSFFDRNGNKIEEFKINYYNTIRKDPFFYHSTTDDLCMDYLIELENRLGEYHE